MQERDAREREREREREMRAIVLKRESLTIRKERGDIIFPEIYN